MRWRKSKRPTKGRDLTAFIDEGPEIEGKYTFNGTVMLVINLKTALALGLTIPQSILLRADQVIQ